MEKMAIELRKLADRCEKFETEAADTAHENLQNAISGLVKSTKNLNDKYDRKREECSGLEVQLEKNYKENVQLREKVENLEAFAQFIIDGYANHDLNHVDFRVGAYKNALHALDQEAPEEKMARDLGLLPETNQ